jgi:formyl-CoA transferase
VAEGGRTGLGQVVRTSLLAAVVGAHAYQGTRFTVAGEVPVPGGNYHPSICPYGLYRSVDGFVQIAVGSDALWQKFAPAFGLDRPGWALNRDRVRDHDAVNAAVDAAFGRQAAAEVLGARRAQDPPGPGRSGTSTGVYREPGRRVVVEVDHPALGPIRLPGPPLRFETGRRETGRARHLAPPLLDQHGESVRRWLDDAGDGEGAGEP